MGILHADLEGREVTGLDTKEKLAKLVMLPKAKFQIRSTFTMSE